MNFNDKSQAYVKLFQQYPTHELISNVKTTMITSQLGKYIFPVTINETEYSSSYVCSPYNALVTYSQDEVHKIKHHGLQIILASLMGSLGALFRFSMINKIVCVNNFLLSTNPYPDWMGEGAADYLEQLRQVYPKHAFMYRSLNEHTNAPLIAELKSLGYVLMPSRQVYIFDSNLDDFFAHNNTQNDRRALAKSEYEVVAHQDIAVGDYARIVQLYNQLYLEKYSQHNPQFSERLIAYWHQHHLLTMYGLRDQHGILQGVVGLFTSEQLITAPLVGYNTALPSSKALYRILIYLVLEYSKQKKCCLNLSSGASAFKMLRGGKPFIEYSAIYINHLPMYRRAVWHFINGLLNRVFVPILIKYKL